MSRHDMCCDIAKLYLAFAHMANQLIKHRLLNTYNNYTT